MSSFVNENSIIQVREVVKYLGDWPLIVRMAFLMIGIFFILMTYFLFVLNKMVLLKCRDRFNKVFILIVSLMVIVTGVFGVVIAPYAAEVLVMPYKRLTLWANAHAPDSSYCLKVLEQPSPTVSVYLKGVQNGLCSSSIKQWYIAPTWKNKECLVDDRVILQQDHHLLLCGHPL